MSHKDAPPISEDQARFEAGIRSLMPVGHTVALGRDKDGKYFAEASQRAWKLWQLSQQPQPGGDQHG